MAGEGEQLAPAVSSQPRFFCRGCGYALVGLPGSTCPECGREFDLGDPLTFAKRPPRSWVRRWGVRGAILLLAISLFVGTGMGWLWWGWHFAQPTIGELTLSGAKVDVTQIGPERLGKILGDRFGYLRDRVKGVRVDGMKMRGKERIDFGSLGSLETLTLFNGEFDQRALTSIGGAKRLQYLNLGFAKIYKPDLSFLRNLRELTTLSLWCVEVDDASLKNVEGLEKMKILFLDMTHVSDAGLDHLMRMMAIEELHLEDTLITDAGLEKLKQLKSLRKIWLKGTRVTPQGTGALQAAIPGLVINWVAPETSVPDLIFGP